MSQSESVDYAAVLKDIAHAFSCDSYSVELCDLGIDDINPFVNELVQAKKDAMSANPGCSDESYSGLIKHNSIRSSDYGWKQACMPQRGVITYEKDFHAPDEAHFMVGICNGGNGDLGGGAYKIFVDAVDAGGNDRFCAAGVIVRKHPEDGDCSWPEAQLSRKQMELQNTGLIIKELLFRINNSFEA